MTSLEIQTIADCDHAQTLGEEIQESTARTIASWWHDGQDSALYAFASSGHYDRTALLAELSDTIAISYTNCNDDDKLALDMLGTYLLNRPREWQDDDIIETWEDAEAYLVKDGNLGVPGGRYGNDTRSCAPFAWAIAELWADSSGDPVIVATLDGAMSHVVNSSDDVVSLLLDHGSREIRALLIDAIA